MSLSVRTDVFKYSFFPRTVTVTDWHSVPLAVRFLQSTQSFYGALQNSASSNRCWLSWHSGGNGWSAPIAGHRGPAVTLLRNNLRQVVHTPLPHSRDTPRGGLWITYQIKSKLHARIESIACVVFFTCMRFVFLFLDCIAGRASVALRSVCQSAISLPQASRQSLMGHVCVLRCIHTMRLRFTVQLRMRSIRRLVVAVHLRMRTVHGSDARGCG